MKKELLLVFVLLSVGCTSPSVERDTYDVPPINDSKDTEENVGVQEYKINTHKTTIIWVLGENKQIFPIVKPPDSDCSENTVRKSPKQEFNCG